MNTEMSKAERTRSFIIENTAEIFNKKGYNGTSLADLTGATGLTKGSIYGNFENKEEVALAVFDYNYSKVFLLIQEAIDKAKTFQDKLLVYPEIYRNITRGRANRGGCPILNTATEADDTNDLLKAKAANALLKWEKSLTRLIEAGIDAGEFRKDIHIRQTALSIIALIEGGVMMSGVTGKPAIMDLISASVESLIKEIGK